MNYKIGDRIPYKDNTIGLTDPIFDQGTIVELIKRHPKFKVTKHDKYARIVIYTDNSGWDFVESLIPAEIFYSPLYAAMKEEE